MPRRSNPSPKVGNLKPVPLPCNVFSLSTLRLGDHKSLPRSSMRFAKTLFLFTKSDIKTIIIPVAVFALATAPLHHSSYMPHVILWTWLHVLQCALANQTLGPDEDSLNKPDRPIPSGRINVEQARFLRWACLVPCLAYSAWFSEAVMRASASLAFFVYIYNELEFNSHWLSRNILNGAGLACFEVGATLIAGKDRTTLDLSSKLAIVISTSIFITTIHTQDFKDELGDRKVGRRTLPMIYPVASRVSVLFALLVWTICLTCLWNVGPLITIILFGLSSIVGGRFVFLKSVVADQRSFYLYNIWLCLANALPALTYRAI